MLLLYLMGQKKGLKNGSGMPEVYQRHVRGMPEVYPKACQRYARSISKGIQKTCPKYVIEGLYLQVDPLKNSPINRKKPKTQIYISDSSSCTLAGGDAARDNLESKFQDYFV
jgi:hypothetical protein